MSVPLAIGDVVQVRVVYKGPAGEEGINVLYYVVTSVGTSPATDNDLAVQFDSANASTILGALPTNCHYDGVEVRVVSVTIPAIIQKVIAGAGPGTFLGTAMGAQVSGIISWLTALAGPAFRGRTYFPFPSINAITAAGIPIAGYLAVLALIANAFFTFNAVSVSGRTANLLQVLWHRKTKTFSYMTASTTNDKFATQKRRGNYGKNRQPPI